MMMQQITLIMAYYENAGMLREHYRVIRDLPVSIRAQINLTIVDDGSPNAPAFFEDTGINTTQIWRADKDIRWNQDFCRNVGVHHCETLWLVLTDMDHIIPPETWAKLIHGKWDSSIVYKFKRVSAPDYDEYKPHPNSWFMTKKMYNKIGGYDERFAGYYSTDWDFRDRVRQNARQIEMLDLNIIRVPRSVIPDASTTTYLRKQPEDRAGLAQVLAARDKLKGWEPLRLQTPYHRVFP